MKVHSDLGIVWYRIHNGASSQISHVNYDQPNLKKPTSAEILIMIV